MRSTFCHRFVTFPNAPHQRFLFLMASGLSFPYLPFFSQFRKWNLNEKTFLYCARLRTTDSGRVCSLTFVNSDDNRLLTGIKFDRFLYIVDFRYVCLWKILIRLSMGGSCRAFKIYWTNQYSPREGVYLAFQSRSIWEVVDNGRISGNGSFIKNIFFVTGVFSEARM